MLQGVDFSPVLADPSTSVRDHVLFAQDSAQTRNLNQVRYALRGFFDGQTKYARYYGVGGGKPSSGLWGRDPGHKLFDVDSDFDDQDHEWYDHDRDPLELVNLANDRARRAELRGLFERLRRVRGARDGGRPLTDEPDGPGSGPVGEPHGRHRLEPALGLLDQAGPEASSGEQKGQSGAGLASGRAPVGQGALGDGSAPRLRPVPTLPPSRRWCGSPGP